MTRPIPPSKISLYPLGSSPTLWGSRCGAKRSGLWRHWRNVAVCELVRTGSRGKFTFLQDWFTSFITFHSATIYTTEVKKRTVKNKFRIIFLNAVISTGNEIRTLPYCNCALTNLGVNYYILFDEIKGPTGISKEPAIAFYLWAFQRNSYIHAVLSQHFNFNIFCLNSYLRRPSFQIFRPKCIG